MTTPTLQFRRATRQALKLKIGIDGPSGSGKTEGALALATGLTNGGKIALIDTENESASYYADRYRFDTLQVPSAQANAEVVKEAIAAAIAAGYEAVVVDSLSHAWLQILNAKDLYMLENPKANGWTAWGLPQFGPRWEKLMAYILAAPVHIIATMRSKQAYEQIEQNGSKKVVKLGLQPQVRDGAEYEFGLVFSVNMAHRAEAAKDRTNLFPPNLLVDLRDPKVHAALIQWMNSETPAEPEAVAQLVALAKSPGVPDVTRAAIDELAKGEAPSANKVNKYRERLEQFLAGLAAGPTPDPAPAPAAPATDSKGQAKLPLTGDSGDRQGPFEGAAASIAAGSPAASANTSALPTNGTSTGPAAPATDSATSTTRNSNSESSGSPAPATSDLEQLLAELRDLMNDPRMPKTARAFFSSRVGNGKVNTVVAANLHLAMARLCIELGIRLAGADERQLREIDALLLQPSTYKVDKLTKLRDQLDNATTEAAAV